MRFAAQAMAAANNANGNANTVCENLISSRARTARLNQPMGAHSCTTPSAHAALIALYFGVVPDSRQASVRQWLLKNFAKEDFSQKIAIFLRPGAQFDYLVALPDTEDRAKAIIRAMGSIEAARMAG